MYICRYQSYDSKDPIIKASKYASANRTSFLAFVLI